MKSFDVIERLKANRELPTPPGVAIQLLDLLKNNAAAPEVARTLECDPAITTRILSYANSPAVGAAGEVSSLPRAIALLGMRRVAVLALSYCFVDTKQDSSCPAFDCNAFWQESIARGAIARRLAKDIGLGEAEEAFVAGLVSDLGRMMLASGFPEDYQKILESTGNRSEQRFAEHETFGTTSDDVGLALLKEWDFPGQFLEDGREANSLRAGGDPLTERHLPRCLALAQLAASAMVEPPERVDACSIEQMVDLASRFLGMDQETWEQKFDESVNKWRDQCAVLDISSCAVMSFSEIERHAREQLTMLSMAAVTESEQMFKRATTDGLTGIPNRSTFDERIELEVERFRRNGGDLLLLILDVDHFKQFNDNHGHQAGDHVLKAVASTLECQIRRVDLAARYGGEEFAVIAPQCCRENALEMGERLRKHIAQLVCNYGGEKLNVTVSVGGAYAKMAGCTEAVVQDVIARADAELYRSKDAGRNQTHIDPADLPATVEVAPV